MCVHECVCECVVCMRVRVHAYREVLIPICMLPDAGGVLGLLPLLPFAFAP